jgi:DNA-3-methyladenine glycosylase II
MAWLDDNTKSRGGPATMERVEYAVEYLRGRDQVLGGLIDRYGPCTLRPSKHYFPVLVEAVISQQLSTRVAKTIYARLLGLCGRSAPRPADIIASRVQDLTAIGLSKSKVEYVKNVADFFARRKMGPRRFARMSDAEVTAFLTQIKGIGEWSAQMFLIFALNRLDVFPARDLGLQNAVTRCYRLRKPPSRQRLDKIGNRWIPFRTIGTWYLWESYDN